MVRQPVGFLSVVSSVLISLNRCVCVFLGYKERDEERQKKEKKRKEEKRRENCKPVSCKQHQANWQASRQATYKYLTTNRNRVTVASGDYVLSKYYSLKSVKTLKKNECLVRARARSSTYYLYFI